MLEFRNDHNYCGDINDKSKLDNKCKREIRQGSNSLIIYASEEPINLVLIIENFEYSFVSCGRPRYDGWYFVYWINICICYTPLDTFNNNLFYYWIHIFFGKYGIEHFKNYNPMEV